MCDTCDTCEGVLLLGRGMGCKRGTDCRCKCHQWDARTALQIVITHKRAKPSLNVAPLAGVHRNKIFAYLVRNMTAIELTRAFDLNSMDEAGIKGPTITSDWVPMDVVSITSKLTAASVVYKDGVSALPSVSSRCFGKGLTHFCEDTCGKHVPKWLGYNRLPTTTSVQSADLLSRSQHIVKQCKMPASAKRKRESA